MEKTNSKVGALAACVIGIKYLGICANEKHMAWVDEVVNKMTYGLPLGKRPRNFNSNHENKEANKEAEKKLKNL